MINIMFCGNDRMFDGMLIALLSIMKHTKETLNVYIITMDLTEQDKAFTKFTDAHVKIIEKKLKEKNKENKVTLIDAGDIYKKEMGNNKNNKTHYTPYIFLRLLADKMDLPEKLLYLDCDLVIYKDIKELFDIDMTDYEIAMALDYLGRKAINPKYMNSGVVLMNLKNIKESGCFEDARQMCMTRKMVLPDQTALNDCCTKKIWLPDKFNEQNKRKEDTVIRHFSMRLNFKNYKPWMIEDVHKHYKIFDYDDIYEEYEKTLKEN